MADSPSTGKLVKLVADLSNTDNMVATYLIMANWCQSHLSNTGKGGVPGRELHLSLSHVVEGFYSSLKKVVNIR